MGKQSRNKRHKRSTVDKQAALVIVTPVGGIPEGEAWMIRAFRTEPCTCSGCKRPAWISAETVEQCRARGVTRVLAICADCLAAGRKPAEPIEYFNPGPRQAGDPKPPEAKPGTVQVREVAHGDWCDLLNRRGPCNCDPETRYVEVA